MGRNGKIEARSNAELWQRTERAGTSLGITYAIVASGARETVRAKDAKGAGVRGSHWAAHAAAQSTQSRARLLYA